MQLGNQQPATVERHCFDQFLDERAIARGDGAAEPAAAECNGVGEERPSLETLYLLGYDGDWKQQY